jgi:hypothetical protein
VTVSLPPVTTGEEAGLTSVVEGISAAEELVSVGEEPDSVVDGTSPI